MQQQLPGFAGICFQTTLLLAALANDASALIHTGPIQLPPTFPMAPASAPSAAPKPKLTGCYVTFTIDNYDYADLSKSYCPGLGGDIKMSTVRDKAATVARQKAIARQMAMKNKVKDQAKEQGTAAADPVSDLIGGLGSIADDAVDGVDDTVDDNLEDVADSSSLLAVHQAPAPAKRMGPPGSPPIVRCFGTVETMLETVVKDTVKGILVTHVMGMGPTIGTVAVNQAAAKAVWTQEPMVGGTRDEHGCLGAAGYTWCEVKAKCLRSWDEECPEEVMASPVSTVLRGAKARQFLPKIPDPPPAFPAEAVGAFAPAAAMPMAPAAAMPVAPAPAPPKPPLVPPVDIFVKFRPGPEKTNEDGKVVGRSVNCSVTVTGTPNLGVLPLNFALEVMTAAQESGVFQQALGDRLFQATGVPPHFKGMEIKQKKIEQWSIGKCRSHFTKIVKEFSMAYTRRMVPQAIYNECSNFMTRITFSDDMVVDDLDKTRCRKATIEFAKRWQFGERKGHEMPAESEFTNFCKNVCDLKFGEEHPRCHVKETLGIDL